MLPKWRKNGRTSLNFSKIEGEKHYGWHMLDRIRIDPEMGIGLKITKGRVK